MKYLWVMISGPDADGKDQQLATCCGDQAFPFDDQISDVPNGWKPERIKIWWQDSDVVET